MTQSWTTLSMNQLFRPKDEVSPDQLNNLLRGKKFSTHSNVEMGNDPRTVEYSPDEIKALEDYCKKRGIVGVNFGNMSPHSILAMIGGKSYNEVNTISKKGLLNG